MCGALLVRKPDEEPPAPSEVIPEVTPEEAEAELARIKEEGRGTINPLDIFNTAE